LYNARRDIHIDKFKVETNSEVEMIENVESIEDSNSLNSQIENYVQAVTMETKPFKEIFQMFANLSKLCRQRAELISKIKIEIANHFFVSGCNINAKNDFERKIEPFSECFIQVIALEEKVESWELGKLFRNHYEIYDHYENLKAKTNLKRIRASKTGNVARDKYVLFLQLLIMFMR